MKLAEVLQRARAQDPTLTEINLSYQDIRCAGMKELAAVLPLCSAVTILALQGNKLGNEGVKILASVLSSCNALSELYLWDNQLGAEGAKALAKVLPSCSALSVLYLGINKLGTEGATALASALPFCKALSDFSFSSNNLGAEGAKALARVLPSCSSLSLLDLDHNKLGITGTRAIMKVLPLCSALSKIYLNGNHLGAKKDTIFKAIESILIVNRRRHEHMMNAITQGNLARISALYQKGVSIFATGVYGSKYYGYTPLLIATSQGQLAIVQWLLTKGCRDRQRVWGRASVAHQDQRKTALEIAKTRGFKKIAALLHAVNVSEAPPPPTITEVKHNDSILNDIPIQINKIPYQGLTYVKRLGKGGFGRVFQGKYGSIDVAIKEILKEHLTEESLIKFKNEAIIISQLHHSNIVTLYGICLEAPHYSLVMELMPNYSLWNFLHTSQEISWDLRSTIALDITAGLAFLHDQDILHCDLKSPNILLDGHFRAKICDFGLAKVKTANYRYSCHQSKEEKVGTLQWMAPELFEPQVIYSKATDIYSYGMVLWELSTQKEPYADTKDNMLIAQRIKDGKKETIPEDCPETLATLITECWHSESQKRISAPAALESLSLWKKQREQAIIAQDVIAVNAAKASVDNAQSSAVGHNEHIESKQSLSNKR